MENSPAPVTPTKQPLPKFQVVGNAIKAEPGPDSSVSLIDRMLSHLAIEDADAGTLLTDQFLSANHKATPGNCQFLNGSLALIAEMQPRDLTETMLSMQMITCHNQVMSLMRQVTTSDAYLNTEAMHPNIKLAERLMRIYTRQMDTLSQYRRKGRQTMVVEHITVKKGGQAIVGNIDQGDRGA